MDTAPIQNENENNLNKEEKPKTYLKCPITLKINQKEGVTKKEDNEASSINESSQLSLNNDQLNEI